MSIRVGALALVGILGAAAAVVLTAGRTDWFSSTAEIVVADVPGLGRPVDDATYVDGFLRDRSVERSVAALAGFLFDERSLRERTTLDESGGRIRLTLRARSPERARDLANAAVRAVSIASTAHVGGEARLALAETQSKLARATSEPNRRRLRREAVRLERLVSSPQPRVIVSRYAVPPTIDDPIDQALNALPGSFPPSASAPADIARVSVFFLIELLALMLVRTLPRRHS
jgi:hypothetical protein